MKKHQTITNIIIMNNTLDCEEKKSEEKSILHSEDSHIVTTPPVGQICTKGE